MFDYLVYDHVKMQNFLAAYFQRTLRLKVIVHNPYKHGLEDVLCVAKFPLSHDQSTLLFNSDNFLVHKAGMR